MFGILRIKSLLIGALLAAPAVGLWMQHRAPVEPAQVAAVREVQTVVRVPVEVISKGNAPEWVLVTVGNQAIPEPGPVSLLLVAGVLLALRRQRA